MGIEGEKFRGLMSETDKRESMLMLNVLNKVDKLEKKGQLSDEEASFLRILLIKEQGRRTAYVERK